MSEQAKVISRQEMYDAVWQTPISKLAPAWGTTIAAVIRACDRLDVPRPETGHWTLVRKGWEIKRPALPEQRPGVPANAPLAGAGGKRESKGPAKPAAVPGSEKPRRKVAVPKGFENAHRFVKQTRKALTTDTYVHNGVVQTRAFRLDKPLHPGVSPEQLDRALLIYDAIIKGIIELGGRFVTGPESWRLQLFVGKQPVEFHIREAMKMLRLDLTDEEKEAEGYSRWDKHEWKGSGMLRFKMYGADLPERVWQDSKRASLEDQVGEIIDALADAEDEAKRIRAVREAHRKQWEEECARREEARRREEERQREIERQRREEEENQKRLVAMAGNWREARLVRRFIRTCEAVLGKEPQVRESWQERWVTWAKAHADRLDPMTNGYLESERQRLGGGGERITPSGPES